MEQRPRIEFDGAIYRMMARGNARQRICRNPSSASDAKVAAAYFQLRRHRRRAGGR